MTIISLKANDDLRLQTYVIYWEIPNKSRQTEIDEIQFLVDEELSRRKTPAPLPTLKPQKKHWTVLENRLFYGPEFSIALLKMTQNRSRSYQMTSKLLKLLQNHRIHAI